MLGSSSRPGRPRRAGLRLKEAASRYEFEKAAELRDELLKLEGLDLKVREGRL